MPQLRPKSDSKPWLTAHCRVAWRASIARIKRAGDNGSSWRTPRTSWISNLIQHSLKLVSSLSNTLCTHAVNNKDKALCVLEVVPSRRSYLRLHVRWMRALAVASFLVVVRWWLHLRWMLDWRPSHHSWLRRRRAAKRKQITVTCQKGPDRFMVLCKKQRQGI